MASPPWKELPLQEANDLHRPVLGLGVEDGEFGVGNVVCPDPDVEQTFADEAEHAAVVWRI